jgi:hypothetical protein
MTRYPMAEKKRARMVKLLGIAAMETDLDTAA